MRLLLPLGLLALVGILVLLLIYIIKPNFQQKLISSTYIWKLSLKFKKRKIPISRLRNILLVACQVLIIASIAMILSKPVRVLKEQEDRPEAVLVIDASASMRTGDGDKTRYERAVNAAVQQAEQIFDQDGIVSVILAGKENTYLAERAGAETREKTIGSIRALLDNGADGCTYTAADMRAAVTMSDRILSSNPAAHIYLYTDETYADLSDNISLVNVADREEWNAAILDATAVYEDNYYTFRVEVASYGKDTDLTVDLAVNGVNRTEAEGGQDRRFSATVHCANDGVYTVLFKYVPRDQEQAFYDSLDDNTVFVNIAEEDRVYSYQSVIVSIDERDSLREDNVFSIYGGQKETVRIQYYSNGTDPMTGQPLGPNVFFQQVLAAIKKNYADRWNIEITQVKRGNPYETSGFDFYIFEHTMPTQMPTDGVVLLADPLEAPENAGFQVRNIVDSKNSVYLAEQNASPVLENVNATDISVSRYNKITADSAYTVLLSYADDPLLLVRNDKDARVAIMSFSLHYSNLPLLVDFPILMYNMFGYFFPSTVDSNAFETGESVSLNCRGESLTVGEGDDRLTFTSFPASLRLDTPGAYTVRQTTYSGKEVVETIYVRMPRAESNIFAEEDALRSPYYEVDESDYYSDVLLYIACALVALLTLEWYLQHRESSL